MVIFSSKTHIVDMKRMLEHLIERESRPERVGPRVTVMREALKLSKAEFADSVSLDRSSLTKIEKGEAGLDIATGERIAALYGFGLNFIYRGDLTDVPYDLRSDLLTRMTARKMDDRSRAPRDRD